MVTSHPTVNFSEISFVWAIIITVFNPTWWNMMARGEYKYGFISKAWGDPYRGCYFLAVCIFLLGIYRDKLFADAVATQPVWDQLDHPLATLLSVILYGVGFTFVISSYWRLGITGTYLGDYFGILMESRVTGFPFNVMSNPMYNGSTMLFVAHALWSKSPAGLLLSLVVFIVYKIALLFEEYVTINCMRIMKLTISSHNLNNHEMG